MYQLHALANDLSATPYSRLDLRAEFADLTDQNSEMPCLKAMNGSTYRIFLLLPTLPIRRAVGISFRRLDACKEGLVSS